MAKMYPEEIRTDTASPAERDLYRLFQEQLPDDYHVMHGVRWTTHRKTLHNRQGEADFVIINKRTGVLFLEVKGGRPELRNGTWYSVSGKGEESRLERGPAEQASDSMHALMARARRTESTKHYVRQYRYQHAVAFPDITARGENWGSDSIQEIIVDSTDRHDLERAILRVAGEIPPDDQASDEAISALVKLYQPDTRVKRPGFASEMFSSAMRIEQLTDEQYAVIDSLHHQNQLAIPGVAGSGKTLLAIRKAEFLAQSGFRVLLTCFNNPLGSWLRERVYRHANVPPGSVRVANVDALFSQLIDESGLDRPAKQAVRNENHFFDVTLPEFIFDHADQITERFDAIIVDEGQDFAPAKWTALQALMSDPVDGIFYIFFDSEQGIYRKAHQFPVRVSDVALMRNCRNTDPIYQILLRYYPGKDWPLSSEVRGIVPEVTGTSRSETHKSLQMLFNKLFNSEGIPTSEAIILTCAGKSKSTLEENDKIGKFKLTWDKPKRPDQVQVETVFRFKGLERAIVMLIPELEHRQMADWDQLMYVGVSRATQHLVVVGELPEPRRTPDEVDRALKELDRASAPPPEPAQDELVVAQRQGAQSPTEHAGVREPHAPVTAAGDECSSGNPAPGNRIEPATVEGEEIVVDGQFRQISSTHPETNATYDLANDHSDDLPPPPNQALAVPEGSAVAISGRTELVSPVPKSSVSLLSAALCYIIWFIVPILALSSGGTDRFTRIHAYQGITFAGLSIAYFFFTLVLSAIAAILFGPLMFVVWMTWVAPVVMGLHYAYSAYTQRQTEFYFLSNMTRTLFKDL